jgi:hypothetical protein
VGEVYDAAISEVKVKYQYVRSPAPSFSYAQDDTLARSRYLHRKSRSWLSAEKINLKARDLEGIDIMAGIPEEARSIMTISPTMRTTTESTT